MFQSLSNNYNVNANEADSGDWIEYYNKGVLGGDITLIIGPKISDKAIESSKNEIQLNISMQTLMAESDF